jgi:tripartite-type tricarboxylate transporter receptor subunit TctC
MFKKSLAWMACAAALIAAAPAAQAADSYPEHPINLIVPFPPGGPTDALARRLADGLGRQLHQTVLVENRAGAGGNIGAEYVAKAAPDGYTILFGTSGPLAINIGLYKHLNYDPRTSFAPIVRIGYLPNILTVNPSLPVHNVQELIAYAKANPNKLTFASSGNGASSHLAGILFNKMAGTSIQHIPYKGTGPAITDLLGGQVSMSFTDILTALPLVKADKLRALGMASGERSEALPNLPTIAEQGLAGYDVSVFFGIVAPKGTPAPIVAQLNKAFVTALDDPAVAKALHDQGVVRAADTTPKGLADYIQAQVPYWSGILHEAKVSID